MANTIGNMDDVIDSRDVIERIEELQAMLNDTPDDFGEDDGEELRALLALQEEVKGYCPDWEYGAQLIRDSYFEQAMDEMLEDIGDLPRDLPSYLTITVDYEALQQDYTAVEFDGITYWTR